MSATTIVNQGYDAITQWAYCNAYLDETPVHTASNPVGDGHRVAVYVDNSPLVFTTADRPVSAMSGSELAACVARAT